MAPDNENKSPGYAAVKPAGIDLTTPRDGSASNNPPRRWRRYGAAALAFVAALFARRALRLVGILIPLALVVALQGMAWVKNAVTSVFSPSEHSPAVAAAPSLTTRDDRTTADEAPPPTTRRRSATGESPWEKAQRAKERRGSQQVLELLLDAQQDLEEKGVTAWGREEYQQGQQRARAGDAAYGQQDFPRAQAEYAKALDIFTGLLDGAAPLLEKTLAAGAAALESGDAPTAGREFTAALAIDPVNQAARRGIASAEVLDEVMELADRGGRLLRDGKAGEAVALYRQALDADPHSARAQQGLRQAEKQVSERAFSRAMSSGFRLLAENRRQEAQQAFSQALSLDPDSRAARDGLEQARHQARGERIKALLAQAYAAEKNENWRRALARYEDVLALDDNLAGAREGKKRTTLRNEMHERLEQTLAQPERLFDRAFFDEISAFRDAVTTLPDPGPVLSGQLSRLARLLEAAATPLQVQLRSDNLTRVTLYKVGELGHFTSKSLALRPGRYVAVGRRNGYRDVRVEFLVSPGKSMAPVVVNSTEKIALGS